MFELLGKDIINVIISKETIVMIETKGGRFLQSPALEGNLVNETSSSSTT